MLTTLPTPEQVDRIARELAPDVVRIRFSPGHDWADYPAIYFRIVLSDAAARDRLSAVARLVRDRLYDELRLLESDYGPHFNFRSQSETTKLPDAQWD
jgi:microcystin degradation protein MlrC